MAQDSIKAAVFKLLGPDNRYFPFRNRTDIARCGTCRLPLDKWAAATDGILPRDSFKFDYSVSLDGPEIVSSRLRDCVRALGCRGVSFKAVVPGFWDLRVSQRAALDRGRTVLREEGYCATCGRFREVTRVGPVVLQDSAQVGPTDIVQADVELASGDMKMRPTFVGAAVAEALVAGQFSGVVLEPYEQ